MTKINEMTYRVSYADTDRMNRVYYANYLVICERARTELLREAGFPYRKVEESGWLFPVRRCNLRYFNFAVYDDLLIARTYISKLRHATLAFTTDIFRDSEKKPLVSATVELACVNSQGKPIVIPDELYQSVRDYISDEQEIKY